MNDNDGRRLIDILEDIRNNQKLQVERQLESLTIQRQQFEAFSRQMERTERLQDKAEKLQDRSAQLVSGARKVLAVVLPILIALLAYVSWLIFR